MNHLESISNGLGAQSMLLCVLACRGEIPATVSITGDTGWESDRTCSDGRKMTSEQYFDEVAAPLCQRGGIQARFVRSRDVNKNHLPSLISHLEKCAANGIKPNIPMFGSRGGRLRQVCTDKWKIRALRQEARRMGAKTNRNAQGIHYGEAFRRVRGNFLGMDGRWSIYQTTVKVKGEWKPVKWQTHYYPLVDLKLTRESVQELLRKEGIPYLLSSECDGCPHKDPARWKRTSPEIIAELARIESLFAGELFFTDKRIPLLEAIKEMESNGQEPDFGCSNFICGV